MGLDVSVYENVRVAEPEEDYDFYAYQAIPEWHYKCKSLIMGRGYMGERVDSLRTTYGGHMYFSIELLELIGRDDLIDGYKIKWDDIEGDIDFYELINFSDCEGCLDSDICKILLANFFKYEDKVKGMEESRFTQLYMKWLEMFKCGSEDGSVVIFH